MGFNIENFQNRDMYYTALAVDGNTKKLKEDDFDDETISSLMAGINTKGNANGILDTEEEIEEFKCQIETKIAEKEILLSEKTDFAKETKKYKTQMYGIAGIGIGLIGALATKGKLKTHPLLGMLLGGILGFGIGNKIGSDNAQKIIDNDPEISDLQYELKDLKEEYRKYEPNYIW